MILKSTVNQVEVEQMHFFFFTLRRSVLIQYEAKDYFGKGLEQSRLSLSLFIPLSNHFGTINATLNHKTSHK